MCYVTCVGMLVVAQCVALSLSCDMSCVTCVVFDEIISSHDVYATSDEMLEPSVVMMCMYATSDVCIM
jgi:hypothetical protein